MLTDNEAVMVHSWNGRMHAIQQEGAPVDGAVERGAAGHRRLGDPEGRGRTPRTRRSSPPSSPCRSRRRASSYLIPYGSVNNASAELMTPEQLENLPTAPAYLEKMFIRNIDWWVENRDAVLERWNEWILE